jgi:M6 family metalloprotease-like protein
VTQGISALGCCGIGDFIKSLLSDPQNAGIDWGAFDNDGPDGVPNSGDDDGYVDALAVIHPTPGAECTGTWPNRIWSHKWSLTDASTSHTPYLTNTAASGGGFILVDDYFVQAAVKCSGVGLNDIGVFTHETGHAFGLPDLYDTRSVGGHEGAGQWDLMAGGTYGCSGTAPYSPCHMSAWSKAALGWVTVDTLPPDTDFGTLMLPPVETTGLVYRIDAADGSDEYFLLENRQSGLASTTFDQLLPGEGLLIWQIDAGVVDARWLTNTVNSADHMGVWLRQADGLDELGSPFGDRGDAGDPFPGSTGNTAFNAATNPAARSYQGTAVGLSLLDVSAPAVSNDVTFRLITGFTAMADQAVDMVATLPTNVQLSAQSGTPPFSWRLVFGALPSGITLQTDGLLLGRTAALGSFGVTVEVTDAVGLTGRALVTLDVAAPSFTIAQLSDAFLLGDQPLDSIQGAFLDQQGNANGTYDLGDFRKWVLANPGLPLSAGLPPAPVPSGPRVLVLPVALQAPERKP